MKRIRKPLHCRADFSWLAPLLLAGAAASGWRRCFWLVPLLLAGAAASGWRRWGGASQGKSKLAPPESSIRGRHRLTSVPLLRRQTKACHFCAAREKQIGRIQRRFFPSPGSDCLELRREPGEKQVGAAGEFHSGAPQAWFGAAAAAPNQGIPFMRRMQRKICSSESCLMFAAL